MKNQTCDSAIYSKADKATPAIVLLICIIGVCLAPLGKQPSPTTLSKKDKGTYDLTFDLFYEGRSYKLKKVGIHIKNDAISINDTVTATLVSYPNPNGDMNELAQWKIPSLQSERNKGLVVKSCKAKLTDIKLSGQDYCYY